MISIIDAGEIYPMIIVAPGIDLSFGMNSALEVHKLTCVFVCIVQKGCNYKKELTASSS